MTSIMAPAASAIAPHQGGTHGRIRDVRRAWAIDIYRSVTHFSHDARTRRWARITRPSWIHGQASGATVPGVTGWTRRIAHLAHVGLFLLPFFFFFWVSCFRLPYTFSMWASFPLVLFSGPVPSSLSRRWRENRPPSQAPAQISPRAPAR